MKKIIEKIHRRHAIEIFVYFVVGGTAWIVQTSVFVFSLSLHIFPSVSMIIGNFLGMIVSYFGHVRFTFKRNHKFSHSEFIKFIITSIFGLCFNVAGVRIITKLIAADPKFAILPTLVTPLITFLISKFWTFK
jgi:putative flippase GtrA